MKEVGIYIHIPFCKRKCYYCDFYSVCADEKIQKEYFEVLMQEIKEVGLASKNVLVKTIYIGGGTPSFVDSKYIVEIMNNVMANFTVYEEAEITIEVNPGTVTVQKLQDYISAWINRISIGMQSSKDDILEQIGRIHSWNDFLQCYKLSREAGFKNINIDCMIGLPNQSLEDVKDTINEVITLSPEHISVYSLIIEEGTKFEKIINEGKMTLPSEELERKMYWHVKKTLEENGYIHYEISNFAKLGFESKHNLDCWHQKEYMGFGAGAHSYTDKCRFSVVADIEQYIENYKENKQEDSIEIHELQDKTAMAKEFILLSLRTIKGCNKQAFSDKFGYDIEKGFRDELEKLTNQELISIDESNIKLTEKGLDLANLVWAEFV